MTKSDAVIMKEIFFKNEDFYFFGVHGDFFFSAGGDFRSIDICFVLYVFANLCASSRNVVIRRSTSSYCNSLEAIFQSFSNRYNSSFSHFVFEDLFLASHLPSQQNHTRDSTGLNRSFSLYSSLITHNCHFHQSIINISGMKSFSKSNQ